MGTLESSGLGFLICQVRIIGSQPPRLGELGKVMLAKHFVWCSAWSQQSSRRPYYYCCYFLIFPRTSIDQIVFSNRFAIVFF